MLLGILIGFIAACFGWQIDLIAIQRGLQRGKTAAFLVGCGAILGDMIFLWVALTGTQPLLEHPEWWGIIRWVGIAVLLLLAVRVYRGHGNPPEQIENVSRRNPTRNFLVGFLVVATNPAIFLLWVGVVGFLRANFEEAGTPLFREFFLAGFCVGGILWFGPLAFIFLRKLKHWSESNHSMISRVSAFVLVGVAVFLAVFEKF